MFNILENVVVEALKKYERGEKSMKVTPSWKTKNQNSLAKQSEVQGIKGIFIIFLIMVLITPLFIQSTVYAINQELNHEATETENTMDDGNEFADVDTETSTETSQDQEIFPDESMTPEITIPSETEQSETEEETSPTVEEEIEGDTETQDNEVDTRDIASGTYGSIPWRITDSGELVLDSGVTPEGESVLIKPWTGYSDDITSVRIVGTVLLVENGGAGLFRNLRNVGQLEGGEYLKLDYGSLNSISRIFQNFGNGEVKLDLRSMLDMRQLNSTVAISGLFSGANLTELDISDWYFDTSPYHNGNLSINITQIFDNAQIRSLIAFGPDHGWPGGTLNNGQNTWPLLGFAKPTEGFGYTGYWQRVGSGTVGNPKGEVITESDGKLLPAHFSDEHPDGYHFVWQPTEEAREFALTIIGGTVNGSTTGSFPGNQVVTLQADSPAAGQVFDYWETSGGGTFSNVNDPNSTFTMPADDVTVTAVYKTASYTLTVHAGSLADGTQTGDFSENEEIKLQADAAPAGQEFSHWETSAGGSFTDISNPNATFIMPSNDTAVTATYKEKNYTLKISNGVDLTDAGPYKAGEKIRIKADMDSFPSDYVFMGWMHTGTPSEEGTFEDESTPETIFTMPANDVEIKADIRPAEDMINVTLPTSLLFKTTGASQHTEIQSDTYEITNNSIWDLKISVAEVGSPSLAGIKDLHLIGETTSIDLVRDGQLALTTVTDWLSLKENESSQLGFNGMALPNQDTTNELKPSFDLVLRLEAVKPATY